MVKLIQYMDEIDYKIIMLYLKRQLKKRGFRYGDLAAAIDVPESTLQKWFAATDGPLSRVNLICKFLGISLKDVLRTLDREPTHEFQFSESQQNLFNKDYAHFAVYWLLVYERLPMATVAKNLGLDRNRLAGILARLDRVGLIASLPGDRLKLPGLRPIRWKPTGKFIQRTFRDWSMGVLSDSLEQNEGTDLIVHYFQLSDSSLEEFARDVRRIEEKYARRTILEMRSGIQKLRGIRFLLAYAQGSYMAKFNAKSP